MLSAHTGQYFREVVDEVLADWEILPRKVSATLTDNGSNIVAAFRVRVCQVEEDNDEDDDDDDDGNENVMDHGQLDESLEADDFECNKSH